VKDLKPISKTQELAIYCNNKTIMYCGDRQNGKSTAMLANFYRRAEEANGEFKGFVITGNYSVIGNTLDSIRKKYKCKVEMHKSDLSVTFDNGAILKFRTPEDLEYRENLSKCDFIGLSDCGGFNKDAVIKLFASTIKNLNVPTFITFKGDSDLQLFQSSFTENTALPPEVINDLQNFYNQPKGNNMSLQTALTEALDLNVTQQGILNDMFPEAIEPEATCEDCDYVDEGIEVGDIVVLNSDLEFDNLMTVVDVDGDFASLTWFSGADLYDALLPAAALTAL